ncbi:hypothetical protein [Lacticaseibacillus rhamnosus]|uniref:hypothetical protein n=1 Tax=Lacticaseibacillus rhamnosus TaxID=47715 RepID=UPI001F4F8AC2|nr:hypothetical protein [Lacticaseibacillus rhamnosus]
MYPEYRQRYQGQLVRVTILSVTTTVAWVIGTIGSQWAVAGVSVMMKNRRPRNKLIRYSSNWSALSQVA